MHQGAVFGGTVVGSEGLIYVISGCTGYDAGPTAAVHMYNPHTDTWAERASIPISRSTPGVAVGPDGKIYVMGGRVPPGYSRNAVEAYDPSTDTWKRVKPMPTPREALSVVAARGADGRVRLYAMGGRGALRGRLWDNLDTMEAYDPGTDTWTTMAPMLIPLHAHAATLGPDGRIYVFGGTNNEVTSTAAVQIYDPVKNSWSRGTPMPYGQECAAVASTPGPDGEILLFAGWDARKRPIGRAVAYNPRTDKWRALPPAPSARAAGGAVAIDEADGCTHVYVIGGSPREKAVEEYSFRPSPRGR
jgi:N-acetylneuraminic acid mutarotase